MRKIFKHKRVILLTGMMVFVSFFIAVVSILLIYHNAKKNLYTNLTDVVHNQRAIITILLKEDYHNNNHIISHLSEVESKHFSIGHQGKIVIARRVGEGVEFLAPRREGAKPMVVPHKQLATTVIQKAFYDRTGYTQGLDHTGVDVFAAYTYVDDVHWAIIALIPSSEVKKPYIETAIIVFILAIVFISLCCAAFVKITNSLTSEVVESEKKLQRAIMSAPFPIMIHAEDGDIVAMNHTWTELTGYSLHDTPTMAQWNKKACANHKHAGCMDRFFSFDVKTERGECDIVTSSNRIITWECSSAPLGTFNDTRLVITMAHDITERKIKEKQLLESVKKAEEAEFFLSESQNAGHIGSFKTDLIGGSWRSSAMLDKIFGIDSSYVRNFDGWLNLVHPHDRKTMNDYMMNDVIMANSTFSREYRIIRFNDGQTRWVQGYGNLIFDENNLVTGLVGTIQDITDRKMIENELIAAQQKAEESNHLKNSFIQNMSHEVRTPLNAINGFSQLMVKPNQNPDKLVFFSQQISNSSEKLISVISDMIEIAHIRAKQVHINESQLDFVPFITNIVENYHDITNQKKLALALHFSTPVAECFMTTDKEKLSKIFKHLIDNAVKFTSRGSIDVYCDINSNTITTTISDTGIGIEEKMQAIVFEPFRQIDTGISRNYGGNGLGLPIVDAYVKLLGGTITMASEINKGTTVVVALPLGIATSQTGKHPHTAAGSAIHTILIAEDETNNYHFLLELFEDSNITIIHASNGKQAIDICRENNSVGLVLMDIKMPVMDGHTAATIIKGFRPDLPIIAQTAFASDIEIEQFSDIFDDYITKPFKIAEVKKTLMKYSGISFA